MRRKLTLFFFSALLAFSSYSQAQIASGIIDPTRIIDWSRVGISGGVPARTTTYTTIDASTYGNGTNDATSAIQAALNSCPSGQVVFLSPGTFRINSYLSIPSNKTLRGAGASKTILSVRGSGEGAIRLGTGDITSSSVNITAGATSGSKNIVVSNASGITVGSYLHITELNDPSYVTSDGEFGSATWVDGFWSGTRARGQIVEVTTVAGTTIGINPGLYSSYSRTPQAVPFNASAKYAGVENLQVFANNTGYQAMISMKRSAYCWIKGVEVNFADGDHVQAFWSFRGEIRDSYFHDGFKHVSGTTDDDIMIAFKSSEFLVENNILIRLHGSIMLNWGAAGNVIAYCYMDQNYDDNSPNVLMMNLAAHGAHPQFNLWEGNVASSIHPDSMWGSSSHGTAFRNWATGTAQICLPYSTRGTPGACHAATQANYAFAIDYMNAYYNLVGNIAGSAEVRALMTETPMVVAPASKIYTNNAYGFTFGYGIDADGTASPSYTTALMHGNYTNADGKTNWTSGVTQALPASFYRSTKPTWFGTVPWPAIGPDVTGGTGPGGHTFDIPAQVCYKNSPKANGMLIFDSETCYGESTQSNPPSELNPPSSLRVVQ
jgi:hypothetical protein